MGTVSLGDTQICDVVSEHTKVKAKGIPEFPQLSIEIKIDDVNKEFFPFKILDILTELHHDNLLINRAGKVETLHEYTSYDNLIELSNYESVEQFNYPITHNIIDFIENKRCGRDITLVLKVALKIGIWDKDRNFKDIRLTSSTKIIIDIPKSYWVEKILQEIGRGRFHVLEIPIPEKTLSKAWSLLEKAELKFYNWDNSGVFSECRAAGVEIDKQMKNKYGESDFTYQQRWLKALKAQFQDYSSIGVHSEEELHPLNIPLQPIKVSRTNDENTINRCELTKIDAEHVLLRTKILLKLAEELLKEKARKTS